MLPTTWRMKNLAAEKFRFAENFISTEKTLWKSRQRNISVCSRAMKCVLMHAYFVKCESFVKDENGKVIRGTLYL